jgi:hypothetical protein
MPSLEAFEEERDNFNRWVTDGKPTMPKPCPSCGDTMRLDGCPRCRTLNYDEECREMDRMILKRIREGKK